MGGGGGEEVFLSRSEWVTCLDGSFRKYSTTRLYLLVAFLILILAREYELVKTWRNGEEKFVIIICCNYLHVPSKIGKRKVSLLDILEKPNLELVSPVVYMRFHELVDKNLIMISIFSPSSFFFFPERITKQLEIKGTTCAKRSMISITCQTSCKIV